jgi:hypothetical protein
MWTAKKGPVSRGQSYMRARGALVGRCASAEARARQPLASHASTSKFADSPPRQRTSSTPQRARPIPGTDRGVEGSALTRQRVVARCRLTEVGSFGLAAPPTYGKADLKASGQAEGRPLIAAEWTELTAINSPSDSIIA